MNTACASLHVPLPGSEIASVMPTRVNAFAQVGHLTRPITGIRAFFNQFNHVSNVVRKEMEMRKKSSLQSDFSSPKGEEFELDGDLSDPEFVYRQCQLDVRRLVLILQREFKTKDAALDWLSRKYKLHSFPRKIFYGEPAKVMVWQWVKIQRALEQAVRINRLREDHDQKLKEERMRFGL